MYVLAIEIAARRQLQRVNRELLGRLEREFHAIVETHGGETFDRRSGTTIYCFRYAGAHELRRIVDAAWSVRTLFEKTEQELFGYTTYLDQLMIKDREAVVDTVERQLYKIPQEGGLWIGPSAATTLTPFFELERRLDLWKAVGCIENAAVLPSIHEFLDRLPVVRAVLDELDFLTDDSSGRAGVLVVHAPDGSGARHVARRAASAINGSMTAPSIVSPPSGYEYVTAFAPLVTHPHYQHVSEYLDSADACLWERVGYALAGAWAAQPGAAQPDHHLEDVRLALRLFVKSFTGRLSQTESTAIIMVERLETLPEAFHSLIMDACREAIETGKLLLLATAESQFVPTAFREVPYRKAALRTLSVEAISQILGEMPPAVHLDPVSKVRTVSRGRPLRLYHYLWIIERIGYSPSLTGEDDEDRFFELLCDALGPAEREALFVSGLAAGRLGVEQLTDVLVSAGHSHLSISELWPALTAFGFIRDTQIVFPSYDALLPFLENRLGVRAQELRSEIQNAVYRSFRLGKLELSPDRYILLADHGDEKISLEVYRHFSEQLLYRNEWELLEQLLSGALSPGTAAHHPDTKRDVEAMMHVLRLASVCRRGNREDAERAYETWQTLSEDELSRGMLARITLARARFKLALDNIEEADVLARRSVLLYQDIGDQEAAGEAQIEFGRVQLALARPSEAREYFAIARSDNTGTLPVIHIARSHCLEAAAAFSYGNYTLAIERADQAEHAAASARNRDWELFAGLIRGRIDMELGRYDDAVSRFSTARDRAAANSHKAGYGVLNAWYGRALSFAGDISTAQNILRAAVQDRSDESSAGAEASLFLAEALSAAGHDPAAIEVLEQRPRATGGHIRPTLSARWNSGFDGIEASTGQEHAVSIIDRLCLGFHGYLLARTGRVDDAVNELRRCTRESRPSDLDPHAPLLYYWYATSLPNNRDSTYDDPATELGRSVKLVQSRAGRTDHQREKIDYRTRNVWYRELFELARHYNLA